MIRIPSDIELLQYLEGNLNGTACRRVAKAVAHSDAARQTLSEVKKDIEVCRQLAQIVQRDLDDVEARQLERRLREAVLSSLY
jgi:hypothetical protein